MIHPLAEVYSQNIGEGTRVWQFAIILEGAIVGTDCNINCHTLIESMAVLGSRVTVKPGVYVWDGVTLEDDVMVGPNATFTNDKFPKSKNAAYTLLETKIKRGASIGANATILCGVSVGEYAMVGAGAVVTKNVPQRALVIGNPAKIIGWMNTDGSKMLKEDSFFIDSAGNKWLEINNELIKK